VTGNHSEIVSAGVFTRVSLAIEGVSQGGGGLHLKLTMARWCLEDWAALAIGRA